MYDFPAISIACAATLYTAQHSMCIVQAHLHRDSVKIYKLNKDSHCERTCFVLNCLYTVFTKSISSTPCTLATNLEILEMRLPEFKTIHIKWTHFEFKKDEKKHQILDEQVEMDGTKVEKDTLVDGNCFPLCQVAYLIAFFICHFIHSLDSTGWNNAIIMCTYMQFH